MDVEALRSALRSAGVREDAFALFADVDERYCLAHNQPYWSIFYSERGSHNDERRFDTEAEACDAFLAWCWPIRLPESAKTDALPISTEPVPISASR